MFLIPLNIWFSEFDPSKNFRLVLVPYFSNVTNISSYHQLSAVKCWRGNMRFWHVLMLIRSHVATSALSSRQGLILERLKSKGPKPSENFLRDQIWKIKYLERLKIYLSLFNISFNYVYHIIKVFDYNFYYNYFKS